MLPHGRGGLSARRMAVLWTFREPSLCGHVPHALMRNAVLNVTLTIPATTCHQRNYVERYSRYKERRPLFSPIMTMVFLVHSALISYGI